MIPVRELRIDLEYLASTYGLDLDNAFVMEGGGPDRWMLVLEGTRVSDR